MYAVNFPPISDAHLNYNFDVSDLDFDTSAVEAQSTSSQPGCQTISAACIRPKLAGKAAESYSSQEDAAEVLPSDWGLHILSMLSKDRTEAPAADPHASDNSVNLTPETAPKQECLEEPLGVSADQAGDVEEEKKRRNQRAQKRHRDRQKAKEEEAANTIASLAAELRRARWEKDMAEERAETLSKALAIHCGSSTAESTRHARVPQYWPSAGWIPQALMTLPTHSGPTQLITAEQFRGMSIEDHQRIWKVVILKLAHLLPATQGRMDTEAGEKMRDVMVDHNMQQACLAAFNFDTSHQLITSNMETGAPGSLGHVPTSKWRSVLAAAELTSLQKEQMIMVRRHYYQQAGHIAARRHRVAPWFQSPADSCRNLAAVSQQLVTSQSAMQELQEVLHLEQTLFVSLLGSMWRRTFTSMQCAIMMVQAYPTAVDVVAVMNCLAEDFNEPSAEELMQSHTSCPIKLDSSALKVPSPDLLLELASWSASPARPTACRQLLAPKLWPC